MATSYPTAATSPIFFYNGFLSQWHTSPFTSPSYPSIKFHTAEQYMMYRKALLFNDHETATKILQTSSPAIQKKLGREVKGFHAGTWDREKERIVEEGNWCKFMHAEGGTGLRDKLLETGERELVEASPTDRIWGIGFSEISAEANRESWGENLLGKALMTVRQKIAAGAQDPES